MAIDLNDPKSIIEVKAPQYSGNIRLDDLIELAKLETSPCFGSKYAYAIALRVLHGLASEELNGGDGSASSGTGESGATTSQKEGDLEIKRSLSAVGSGAYAGLETTSYGTELVRLIRTTFSTPRNRFSKC